MRLELSDWRRWWARAVVMGLAACAGLAIVGFTWLTEEALRHFSALNGRLPWAPLLWTPLCTAAIVWVTRRWFDGAAGSGIPQVIAALDPAVTAERRGLFVSLKLSLAKAGLTAWGLLAGLSLGREGPSVQIAAGVMHGARLWLPRRSGVSDHGLLLAGGAAGIAAAFNTPLAGVMFAIEGTNSPHWRNSGLIVTCIVLAGLIAMSIHGNATYFGVIEAPQAMDLELFGPALLTAVASGLFGGLFARVLVASLSGRGLDRFSRWRRVYPVRFAAGCGLAVAVIGLATGGTTFGGGYAYTRGMIEGGETLAGVYAVCKLVATWLSSWAGVPGGIFAPALAIGGALGNDVALLTQYPHAPTLIALGMAGFLAAATQTPMTAFIIVMEMVDGHAMVLSLMASALVASALARLVGPPLYATMAAIQLERLPPDDADADAKKRSP
jgi:H+/Cl- antiporter ClcA